MIAPFWVDFTFRTSGAVYSRATNDQATLDQVAGMIANLNPGFSDYQPTLAVVITWFEARPRSDNSNYNVRIIVLTRELTYDF